MTKTEEVLRAVQDASAALTLALGDQETLAGVAPQIDRLQRALARAQTLLVMHPELSLNDDVPAGALPPEEEMERIATIASLRLATSLPSAPVTVTLRAPALQDGSYEDTLRQWLDDRTLTAQPDGMGYVLDLSGLVSFLADTFIPPEEDDIIEASKAREMTPARRKLYQAFGPREKEDT
ncbi:MAG TPA: hypothetical protein VFE45_13485 [Coriobacteriia bacterium]|nr:hypothetical protein [Coriobacteriia bacterium]